MDIFLQILLVLVLVFLNGFFVAAEFAAIKLRTPQIEDLVEAGNSKAILAKRIITNLDAFLSATQVGITLASLALGWVGEPLTSELVGPVVRLITSNETVVHSVGFVLGFLLLTSFHIVLGEQLPKSLAITYEKEVMFKVAKPLTLFYKIFRPLIWALNELVNLTLQLFGFPQITEDEGHTREELRSVIEDSARRGVVEKSESTMIDSLFELRDTTAREIMVHRSSVVAIDLDSEPREILRIIETEGFSRLPVYRNSIDEISGVLHVKDLLPHIGQLEKFSAPSQNTAKEFYALLERAVRPPLFISETQVLSRLLYEFQRARMHLGVIVSEHGGVEGIVSLEDILEELVGEIRDESDVPGEDRDVIEIGQTVYVNPMMTVFDFNERFEKRFPPLTESAEYSTVSGYVQKNAGRIPNVGDVILSEGLKFTITRKVRNRLQQIKIELAAPAPQNDGHVQATKEQPATKNT